MLTAEKLRELLGYDQNTGVMTWRVKPNRGGVRPGDVAGCDESKGYRQIWIAGRNYKAHRLAWLHFYGEWPKHHIDHIDGDRQNNRIANLRDVPQSVNAQNQRRAHKDSKTGLIGVSPDRGKFSASIKHKGKLLYLGSFDTAEQAHEAYVAAKREIHTGCAI